MYIDMYMDNHPAKSVLSVTHRICYYSIIWRGKDALRVYSIKNLKVGVVRMYSSASLSVNIL